jgi:hypothetical protein
MRCCFDKRVWIGLGALAVGLLIADPRAGWVALPVLAGLACPLSILFMMRGMRRGTGVTAPGAPGGERAAGSAAADRATEIARLRSEPSPRTRCAGSSCSATVRSRGSRPWGAARP